MPEQNQILLLPNENYAAWLAAAKDYMLRFGVNSTSDRNSAGTFMYPTQIVSVVISRDPARWYGEDIVQWFKSHFKGTSLDVILAETPEELASDLRGRLAANDRFAPLPDNLPPVPAPTPAPAAAPVPAAPPPPAPAKSKYGLTGELALAANKPSYAASIENISIRETLRNPTKQMVRYGVLGIKVTRLSGEGEDAFLTSWSGDLGIGPGCTGPTDLCGGPWDVNIQIPKPGWYRLTLDICYSPKEAALSGKGEWETLTSGVDVCIVNWHPGDPEPVLPPHPGGMPLPNPSPAPAPAPTPAAPAPSGGPYTANGIHGDYFRIDKPEAGPNQDVWFDFSATNTGLEPVAVGGLGAIWGTGSQASWGDFIFDGTLKTPDNVLEWTDHLNIPARGTYQVRLGVCFLPSRDAAEKNLGEWKFLSDPIIVTIR
jgi:hypothetical protein